MERQATALSPTKLPMGLRHSCWGAGSLRTMAPNTSAHNFNLRASGGQLPGTVLLASDDGIERRRGC